jgi:hypothetical protein
MATDLSASAIQRMMPVIGWHMVIKNLLQIK